MLNELFVTQKVRVGDLVPHAKNPRKITAEKKRQLWERIQKFGMISIPVRDFDNTILGGKQRCELLVEYGFADYEIDVRTAVRKLTEEEVREVLLIENSHAGDWDYEMLRNDFKDFLNLEDFDIVLKDLEEQIQSSEIQKDEPELPIVPVMSEKYSAIVVVCRNEIDENHIHEKLGLSLAQCYKTSKVGLAKVVDAKTLIATWK